MRILDLILVRVPRPALGLTYTLVLVLVLVPTHIRQIALVLVQLYHDKLGQVWQARLDQASEVRPAVGPGQARPSFL